MSTAALAQEVKNLRADINTKKTDHVAKYAAAEEVDKKVKAKYPDAESVLSAMSQEDFLEIDAAFKEADELQVSIAGLNERLISVLARKGETVHLPIGGDTPGLAAGVGERFLASEQYEQFKAQGFQGNLGAVEVASREELHSFLAAASDGTGLIPVDQQLNNPVQIPRRAPRLLDLITIATTDTDAVEYSYQSKRVNNAAGVATGGTASQQSEYEWLKETANVKRRAHHIVAPRSQLADAARMRTELETELSGGLLLSTEAQVLGGDGTGENFRGVSETVGINVVAKGANTIPDATHMGITAVRIALEDDITAIGVHPVDYERYVLAKGDDGHYLSGRGPQDSTARTMWGYPAIVSTVFTPGIAVPANWKWAYLWVRSGIELMSGFINQQMIEDMTTINAEYRGAFAVKQPKAFCTVTGLGA